jgi:hypothetical protein
MGSRIITYYLRNRGPNTCSMIGYPGFALLFANGSIIQHPAARTPRSYSRVVLAAGQRAQFLVKSTDPSIPGSGCSTSWKTAWVQAYPPNETTPIRQPSTVTACNLEVLPVTYA